MEKLVNLVAGEVLGFPAKPSDDSRDINCVRFTEEQSQEISADQFSQFIFRATRVSALDSTDIVTLYSEPHEGAAHEVLMRFAQAGLVHQLANGKYLSNFRVGFPNFTGYKHDRELEAEVDARVFEKVKKHAGDRDYWKDHSYFSVDGFFTLKQTKEIKKMLLDIKFYVKNALEDNVLKGSLDGLRYRRHKFYDISFGFVFAFLFLFSANKSHAGNDPGIFMAENIAPLSIEEVIEGMNWSFDAAQLAQQGNVWMDGNDPGGSRNLFMMREQNNFNFDPNAILSWTQDQKTKQVENCGAELAFVNGSLNYVNKSCLGSVKFATTKVCSEFGDNNFCAVAEKAANVWSQKYVVPIPEFKLDQ